MLNCTNKLAMFLAALLWRNNSITLGAPIFLIYFCSTSSRFAFVDIFLETYWLFGLDVAVVFLAVGGISNKCAYSDLHWRYIRSFSAYTAHPLHIIITSIGIIGIIIVIISRSSGKMSPYITSRFKRVEKDCFAINNSRIATPIYYFNYVACGKFSVTKL